MIQALCNIQDVPPSVTVLEQEVSTVEEFVYLGALIHSPTHSSPDIMRRSAFTRTTMQSLDKQLWRSRISLSTKLRLYNTCILPIFLYGSECWAITKEDVSRINALHQRCLPICFSASSGITSSPTMKFDARPTKLYSRKLSRHGV